MPIKKIWDLQVMIIFSHWMLVVKNGSEAKDVGGKVGVFTPSVFVFLKSEILGGGKEE